MHLGRAEQRQIGSRLRSSVAVEVDGHAEVWWLEVDQRWSGQVDRGAAPFLPLAALVAAVRGEDLSIDGPVDPLQREGLDRASERYRAWWGLRPPAIRSLGTEPVGPGGADRALLFSRGVDSSAELASSVLGESAPFDLVVTVAGVDALQSPATSAVRVRRTCAAAGALGVPCVVVTTNLREVADGHLDWDRSHGAVIAGAGLLLGGRLGELVLSQAVAVDTERRRDRPYGVHRDLIGAWSTSGTRVTPGDPMRDRVDKVTQVLRVPELAAAVQVCWESDRVGNCGRCEKCCGTATALAVIGRWDVVDEWFDAPLSPAVVRRLPATDPTRPGALLEVLGRLTRAALITGDPALVELDEAWAERGARAGSGPQVGLGGLDPAAMLRDAGPAPDGPAVRLARTLGWGAGATPLHVGVAERDRLMERARGAGRPVPWCQVDRLSPASARVAGTLAEIHPGGLVALVEVNSPTVTVDAVRRILEVATLRVWASEAQHLEAVPLIESLQHGCVPIQVSTRVADVRRELPEWAHFLVADLDELALRWPDDEHLDAAWNAAVALVAAGSARRDAASLPSVASVWEVVW
jgi:hypothetical protein